MHLGVEMADYWQADDGFFTLLRDKEVLTRIIAEVAGNAVATANAGEKTKVMKAILRDHLGGTNGRQPVTGWVPRWMAFPPSAYTERGGVGTVKASELVAAVRDAGNAVANDDINEPDPATPGAGTADNEEDVMPDGEALTCEKDEPLAA